MLADLQSSIHVAAIIEGCSAAIVAGTAALTIVIRQTAKAARSFVLETISPELAAMRSALEVVGARMARLENKEATTGLHVTPPKAASPAAGGPSPRQ